MNESTRLKNWMQSQGLSADELAKKTETSRSAVFNQLKREGDLSKQFKRQLAKAGIDLSKPLPLKSVKLDTSEYDHYISETLKAKDSVIVAKDMVITEKDKRIQNLEDIISMLRDRNATKESIEKKMDDAVKVLLDTFKSSVRIVK